MSACVAAAFWLSGNWGAQNGAGARTITGAAIAAAAVPLRTGPGTLQKILVVTDNGTNPILVYDNASVAAGVVVAVVPASAKAGDLVSFYSLGYSFGLTIAQTASAGDLTLQY